MSTIIQASQISDKDAQITSASIERLQPYLTSSDRSLVFFVGAGASSAGNTGMPGAPALIQHLLIDALERSESINLAQDELLTAVKEASWQIGFEITLNDFWQICHEAISLLFESLISLETDCLTNRVHTFLAYWLSTGGTVVTTNYDRLIEREWAKRNNDAKSRYKLQGQNSFSNWKKDLEKGGCLFKIHGSLDDPESCLGALEHVGTQLRGQKADLLAKIVHTRPLCFVGWRGVDPDIPPLLREQLGQRNPSLPVFWVHYEGSHENPTSLRKSIENTPAQMRLFAERNPILTEADRAFAEILRWFDIATKPNPDRQTARLDFTQAVNHCSRSGAVRMVGIALRRANKFDEAMHVFDMAKKLASTSGERSAVLQEQSLLLQQRNGRETRQARRFLSQARQALEAEEDPWLQANNDFGLLSMTVINIKSQPWLLFKLPFLFRQYRRDIKVLQQETSDQKSVALHQSLLHLYLGKLRFKLFGWSARYLPFLTQWIIRPFNVAYATIKDAGDIHLHSRIDVLAYRSVALAYLGESRKAKETIPEIDRLVAILAGSSKDNARARHWIDQKQKIEEYCRSYKNEVKQNSSE